MDPNSTTSSAKMSSGQALHVHGLFASGQNDECLRFQCNLSISLPWIPVPRPTAKPVDRKTSVQEVTPRMKGPIHKEQTFADFQALTSLEHGHVDLGGHHCCFGDVEEMHYIQSRPQPSFWLRMAK